MEKPKTQRSMQRGMWCCNHRPLCFSYLCK